VSGVGSHLRQHVIAYAAMFIALGGTAVALPGTGSVTSDDIAKKAVKSKAIAKRAVKGKNLASKAVKKSKIASAAVVSAKIADGAVQSAKIADGAVDRPKLADNAVNGAKERRRASRAWFTAMAGCSAAPSRWTRQRASS